MNKAIKRFFPYVAVLILLFSLLFCVACQPTIIEPYKCEINNPRCRDSIRYKITGKVKLELKFGHTERNSSTVYHISEETILDIEKIVIYYTNYNENIDNFLGVENPVETYATLPIEAKSKIAVEVDVKDFVTDDYAFTTDTTFFIFEKDDFNQSIDIIIDSDYLNDNSGYLNFYMIAVCSSPTDEGYILIPLDSSLKSYRYNNLKLLQFSNT